MARRKNVLSSEELAIVQKVDRREIDTFKEAFELFIRDCEVRNLRPATITYYLNEVRAFLNQLRDQGIDISSFKPGSLTEEHIKNNVILYMRNTKRE